MEADTATFFISYVNQDRSADINFVVEQCNVSPYLEMIKITTYSGNDKAENILEKTMALYAYTKRKETV